MSSFEEMLADPNEQFDRRGELLKSIAEYANAEPCAASADPFTPVPPTPAEQARVDEGAALLTKAADPNRLLVAAGNPERWLPELSALLADLARETEEVGPNPRAVGARAEDRGGGAVSEDDWGGDEPAREYPDILEFIEARLKEALAMAGIIDPDRRQPRWCFGPRLPDGTYVLSAYGPMADAFGTVNLRAATHAAYFDPTWVQRDVAAKRLILKQHGPWKVLDYEPPVCDTCHDGTPSEFSELSDGAPWPCPTLRALACGFDWHRDFNPAWRLR